MAQQHHQLRPLRAAFSHDGERGTHFRPSVSPDNLLPKRRRIGVLTACNACKKKKARCNGEKPCRRCVEADRLCEYSGNSQRTKISTLQARVDQLDREFDAIKTGSAFYATPKDTQNSQDAQDTQDAEDAQYAKISVDEHDNSGLSTPQTERETVGPGPFHQLISWKSAYQSLKGSAYPVLVDLATVSLPPPPVDAYISHSQPDMWTRTGWTKAHIQHLLNALFTWETLPIGLLYHDEFFQDFYNNSNRFCSSALVYSMLAAASRLINKSHDDSRLLPSGWVGSKVFFDEAEALLYRSRQAESLPDIQALGFLSLYHIRCGREEEAQQLAGDLVGKITALCQQAPPAGETELFSRIQTTTYCGAVSLSRMVHLTTGVLFNVPTSTLQGRLSILSELSIIDKDVKQACNTSVQNSNATFQSLQQSNDHLVAAEICRLTELVYHVVASARLEPRVFQHEILAAYSKCLDWYQGFFELISEDGPRTPFILFAHMYYHFCLLCAFRPVLNVSTGGSAAHPAQICAQAAQSILALAQSYEDLFTLRRVPALLPYFVCTAGLYGLSMKQKGTALVPSRLRRGSRLHTGAKPESDSTGASNAFLRDNSPHTKMSAAAHARLLLAKMASSNPVVVAAEQMLFERN